MDFNNENMNPKIGDEYFDLINPDKIHFEKLAATPENPKKNAVPEINEIFTLKGKSLRAVAKEFKQDPSSMNPKKTEIVPFLSRVESPSTTTEIPIIEQPLRFYIVFEDPETREYVSRVSGFRSGNKVFLNDIRRSANKQKYTDEDILDFTRLTSVKMLKSLESVTVPIEEVLIQPDDFQGTETPISFLSISIDSNNGIHEEKIRKDPMEGFISASEFENTEGKHKM